MALLKGTCHNVLLSGNLKTSNVLSVHIPFDDINSNLWQISIHESSQHYKVKSNVLSGISCNLVSDITYNSQKQIINHNPILWQMPFVGEINQKKVQRFNQNWFYVTNTNSILKLKFWTFIDGDVVDQSTVIDCDVYVTLLMQRVK